MSHSRQGAITVRCGAMALYVSSKRTWSLPLPVQPCASASQPVFNATSACRLASSGRAIEVPSRYLCSYTAPERTSFHKIVGDELFAHVLDMHFGSAGLEGLLLQSVEFFAALPDVAANGHHFAAVVLFQPRNDDGCIQAAGVGERHFFQLCSLISYIYSCEASYRFSRSAYAATSAASPFARAAVLGLIEDHAIAAIP